MAGCWAGKAEKPTNKEEQLAQEGDAGIHVDMLDLDDCNLVMHSCVKGVPSGHNCVSFLSPEGGACFQAKTMNPDYVCLVFSKTYNLHGSVFTDKK